MLPHENGPPSASAVDAPLFVPKRRSVSASSSASGLGLKTDAASQKSHVMNTNTALDATEAMMLVANENAKKMYADPSRIVHIDAKRVNLVVRRKKHNKTMGQSSSRSISNKEGHQPDDISEMIVWVAASVLLSTVYKKERAGKNVSQSIAFLGRW